MSPDIWGFRGGSVVKNPPTMQETQVQSLGQEDPLEKGITTHFNILAWRIPWTEELSRLPWGPKDQTQLSDLTFIFMFTTKFLTKFYLKFLL